MPPRVYSSIGTGSGALVVLDAAAATHVTRVLRLGQGAALTVFDGSGIDYAATIERTGRDGVLVRIGDGRPTAAESPLDITLLQGLTRSARMDLVIQKATELGVSRIQVLTLERSVVRLDAAERADRRLQHWRRVAISACEQCGRSVPPTLPAPQPLAAALAELPPHTVRLLLDPAGQGKLPDLLEGAAAVALLVGPEGGLAPQEKAAALAGGFRPLRLGPRILRTETAPLAALSLIQFLAGDLGRAGP